MLLVHTVIKTFACVHQLQALHPTTKDLPGYIIT